MGVFDFVATAGHKIVGDAATVLAEKLHGMDLPTDDVRVRVEDGKAVLEGSVPDQETAQKLVVALGNHAGIAAVDDQLTVKAGRMGPAPVFVTVQKGDTLSGISLRIYGVYHLYNMIFGANQPMIKDADEIFPGQVLRIPPAPAFVTHTVKRGETLSRIAKYWTGDAGNYKQIFEANRDQLSDPDKIEVGQVLKIPVKQPSAVA